MTMKKEIRNTIVAIIVGLLIGILSKMGDVIPQGTIVGDLLWRFGLLSSSFTIWVFLCLLICNKSSSRSKSSLHVILFLIAMLCSYYLYSKFVVKYLSLKMVKFWFIMVIPSGIAAYFLYDIKNKNKIFKILVLIFTIILSLIGIMFVQGIDLFCLIAEFILVLLTSRIIFEK